MLAYRKASTRLSFSVLKSLTKASGGGNNVRSFTWTPVAYDERKWTYNGKKSRNVQQNHATSAADVGSDHFKSKNIPARWSPTKDTPLYAWSQATKWDCMERALGLNAFNNTSLFE